LKYTSSCSTNFLISATVAEFKGPEIFGAVRLAQVNMELPRIEANFSGLSPGKHGSSISEFGDLTRGAASTGKVFNPIIGGNAEKVCFFLLFFFFFFQKKTT
jgi:copper chaperone for superoxide dismutase